MPPPDTTLTLADGAAALWWSQVPTMPGERLGLIGSWQPGGVGCELLQACCDRQRGTGN